MSNSSLDHATVPASVPPEFPEILRELNRAILKAQPGDIVGFCADYFTKKKAEEPEGCPEVVADDSESN